MGPREQTRPADLLNRLGGLGRRRFTCRTSDSHAGSRPQDSVLLDKPPPPLLSHHPPVDRTNRIPVPENCMYCTMYACSSPGEFDRQEREFVVCLVAQRPHHTSPVKGHVGRWEDLESPKVRSYALTNQIVVRHEPFLPFYPLTASDWLIISVRERASWFGGVDWPETRFGHKEPVLTAWRARTSLGQGTNQGERMRETRSRALGRQEACCWLGLLMPVEPAVPPVIRGPLSSLYRSSWLRCDPGRCDHTQYQPCDRMSATATGGSPLLLSILSACSSCQFRHAVITA